MTMPYFQMVAMLWTAYKYSQFWTPYNNIFILYIGILYASITSHLNIAACARTDFSPLYIDPFVFWAVLWCDSNQVLDSKIVGCAYIGLLVIRTFLHFWFMYSLINQLTHHLKIPFFYTGTKVKSK